MARPRPASATASIRVRSSSIRPFEEDAMTQEKVTFGAGCFWGVEYVFRRVPGVVDVQVGYSGGMTKNPTYEQVCSHTTGHAEVCQVTFDPEQVPFDQLLEEFWAVQAPTQVNRPG